MVKFALIVLPLVFSCALIAPALADSDGCVQKIEQCFIVSAKDRAECFYEASTTLACQNNDMGKLAALRAGFAENTENFYDPQQIADSGEVPANDSTARALMGNVAIDSACLQSFDNQWSALLLSRGSKVKSSELISQLTKCRSVSEFKLPNP